MAIVNAKPRRVQPYVTMKPNREAAKSARKDAFAARLTR